MNLSKVTARAEEQASLWAAKLDGSSLTNEDREALDHWLAENPHHRTLLSQYCQFSADLEQDLPALVAAGAVTMPAEPTARRRFSRPVWFATALAAAVAVAVTVWVARPSAAVETVATSVAQRKTLKLADGSTVELNARTSLRVDLSAHERHVRMADGEAFFTVAKDKSRPFIVETPAGAVRVTGTVFDVHADTATNLAVTVVEGSVLVTPCRSSDGTSAAPVPLVANDQLVASPDGTAPVRKLTDSELDDALAWRRGEAVFQGTRLDVAIARFARYHGRTIRTAASVAAVPVGGRYRLDDLDGFLDALEAILPVRVTRDQSSGAIAVSPRTGN